MAPRSGDLVAYSNFDGSGWFVRVQLTVEMEIRRNSI
jgi:hypothetical protein